MTKSTIITITAGAQGIYYVVTGIWPLVHMPSFLRVTGPKRDLWLVQTVGVLVAIIGCVLLFAVFRGSWSGESVLLGMASAVGLAAVDVTFVARRIIPPIYLLDATAEMLLLMGWLVGPWAA